MISHYHSRHADNDFSLSFRFVLGLRVSLVRQEGGGKCEAEEEKLRHSYNFCNKI